MCLEFYSRAHAQTLRAAHIHLEFMKRPLAVLLVQELGAWNKIVFAAVLWDPHRNEMLIM